MILSTIKSRRSYFPVIRSTATCISASAASTTHPITIPTPVVPGDLLICLFSIYYNPTCTASAGWTKYNQSSNSTSVTGAIFYKVATGEDELTITSDSSRESKAIVYCISGANAVNGTSGVYNSSNAPNPPAHTPSDANKQYLFIVFVSSPAKTYIITSMPTGYSGLLTSSGGTNWVAASSCSKNNCIAADDPSAATITSSASGVVWTLAVYNNP